jgi:formate dehydrogenase subunit gamma
MSEPKRIYRFTVGERLVHWVHGFGFLILLFTGLGVLLPSWQPAMNVFGGIQVTRDIHRVVAVIFTASVILGFSFGEGGRNLRGWIKDVLAFGRDDFLYAKNFVVEFLGGHKPFPPQGKFNGGEKLNSMLTISGMILVALSGFVLWFAPSFPPGLVQWAYPVHALFALLMTAALLAHMYLGLLHPDSNQAISGMINGYVPAKFAYEHYEKWYNEVKDDPRNM